MSINIVTTFPQFAVVFHIYREDFSATVIGMEISQQAKNELRSIHLNQTGENLSDDEIEAMAQDFSISST
ncbi:MAG: hypothetical protein R3F48_08515 [Candidatus Zixiibacteriota bacterium]